MIEGCHIASGLALSVTLIGCGGASHVAQLSPSPVASASPSHTSTPSPSPTPTCRAVPNPTFQPYGGGSCRSVADCPPIPPYLFGAFCWAPDPTFQSSVRYICPAQECHSSSDCPLYHDCEPESGSILACQRRECTDDGNCDANGYCVNHLCYDRLGTCAAYAP
jgi:hypothetical protein